MARLFHQRPDAVAEWSGREILAALAAVGDARPLEDWLHLALAEQVAMAGGERMERILERWGFPVAPAPGMSDEELFELAARIPGAIVTEAHHG